MTKEEELKKEISKLTIKMPEHRKLLYQQRMKGRMEGELIGYNKCKADYNIDELKKRVKKTDEELRSLL